MPCTHTSHASRHDDHTPSRRLGFLVRRRHDSTKNNPRLRHTHKDPEKVSSSLARPSETFPGAAVFRCRGASRLVLGSHIRTSIRETTLKQRHQLQNTHTRTERERLTACSGRRSWPSRTTSQSSRRTGSGTSSCKYPPGSRSSRPAACTWCTSSSARA